MLEILYVILYKGNDRSNTGFNIFIMFCYKIKNQIHYEILYIFILINGFKWLLRRFILKSIKIMNKGFITRNTQIWLIQKTKWMWKIINRFF